MKAYDIFNSFTTINTIRVDVINNKYVIEAGLDKRSSLDSIQQALFASRVTGKIPVVVIYDTDGFFGKYEFRIETAARAIGIKFYIVSMNDIKNFKLE